MVFSSSQNTVQIKQNGCCMKSQVIKGLFQPRKKSRNMGATAPKVSKGRSQTSSVSIALWSPPQRRNPCFQKKSSYGRKTSSSVAPIWRDTA
jgi:hypothetical protein